MADRLKEMGEERSDVDKELRRSVAAASLASSLNDSLDSALNKMNENFAQLGSIIINCMHLYCLFHNRFYGNS